MAWRFVVSDEERGIVGRNDFDALIGTGVAFWTGWIELA